MNSKTKSKQFRNTLKKISEQTSVLALGIMLLVTLGCNFLGEKKAEEVKIEHQLTIDTKIGKENFKVVSGYYYLYYDSKEQPHLYFHLADYELDPTDEESLKEDRAYEKNQIKVDFSFKINKPEKFEDLVGEYSSTSGDKVYVFPRVYSDKGAVKFDTMTSDGVIKIEEIKDGIIKGKIDYVDKKENSIKGTFTAKAIGKELKKFEKDKDKDKETE